MRVIPSAGMDWGISGWSKINLQKVGYLFIVLTLLGKQTNKSEL
jgi:hypothetical protein